MSAGPTDPTRPVRDRLARDLADQAWPDDPTVTAEDVSVMYDQADDLLSLPTIAAALAERDALRATVDQAESEAFGKVIDLLDNVLPTYTEDEQAALRSFRMMLTLTRRALDGATQAAQRPDGPCPVCYGVFGSHVRGCAAQGVPLTACAAASDGECHHGGCPQIADGEPAASGRHCPLDTEDPQR